MEGRDGLGLGCSSSFGGQAFEGGFRLLLTNPSKKEAREPLPCPCFLTKLLTS